MPVFDPITISTRFHGNATTPAKGEELARKSNLPIFRPSSQAGLYSVTYKDPANGKIKHKRMKVKGPFIYNETGTTKLGTSVSDIDKHLGFNVNNPRNPQGGRRKTQRRKNRKNRTRKH